MLNKNLKGQHQQQKDMEKRISGHEDKLEEMDSSVKENVK